MATWVPDDRDALFQMAADLAATFASAEQQLIRATALQVRAALAANPDDVAAGMDYARLRALTQRLVTALQQATPQQVASIVDTAAEHGANSAVKEIARLPAAATTTAAVAATPGAAAAIALTAEVTNALEDVTRRVLRYPDDVYRRVLAQTSVNVILGGRSSAVAQAHAWHQLATRGVSGFVDVSGRRWNLATYVEMATRTATRRAWEAGHTATLTEHDITLVTIVVGNAACKKCAEWGGRILRTDNGPTGRVTVPRADGEGDITITVAGTVDDAKRHGWLHPNCRCRQVAYLPGITRTPTATTYNPEAEAAQAKLRDLEVRTRKAKMDAAGALDGEQKKAADAKVRDLQAQIRQHVETTGLPRRRDREQVNLTRGPIPDGPLAEKIEPLPSMRRTAPATRQAPAYTDRAAWKRRQDALPVDFHGETVDPHEVHFVERMLARGERLEWIPKNPDRTPSYDFTWHSNDKIQIELKSTKAKYSTVRGAITKAVVRAREHGFEKANFMIDLGDGDLTADLRDEIAGYNVDRSRSAIKNLWVMTHGVIHKIELR